jgi:hypothetical protein
MPVFRLLALAGLASLLGCAPQDPPSAPQGSPLLASVKATTVGADSAVFTLQVTNTAAAPLALTFGSGQTFDFIVMRGAQEVWRWSGDRMFTQSLRSETIGPGETRTYTATWTPLPRASGDYTVRGILTALNVQAEQTTQFRL